MLFVIPIICVRFSVDSVHESQNWCSHFHVHCQHDIPNFFLIIIFIRYSTIHLNLLNY
jgi:hypothetical protein